MGNDFEEFLKAFGAHTTLITQADSLLLQLGQYTDEYNRTGEISKESVDDMREKFFEFVKGITSLVYGSEIGKIIKKAKSTIKSGVEFLQSFKEYTDGDAKADEMIDAACGFIGNISKYYPVIGPVIGPLFDKAAKIYFNAVKEESELIQGYEELIDYYLDEYYRNAYYQDYITALGNDEGPDTTPADTTSADTTPADTVDNSVIIIGTDGDDKLANSKDNAIINALGGDDTVGNFGNSVTIHGGHGDDSIDNSGKKVMIDAGAGNDKIQNSYSRVTINAGSGDDSIYNVNGCSLGSIDGDDGNDYVYNEHEKVTINGGAGDDSVINQSYTVKVKGGEGNDEIHNEGFYVKINGGSGDDSINNIDGSVSIDGGEGNDYVKSNFISKILFQYKSGDGNDTVNGFNGDDTLSISGGTYSTELSGNDILVRVGTGSIRFLNANCYDFKIIGTYAPSDTTPASTTLTVTNATSSPVTISSAIEVVDASTRTKAVKITGNALDNTITGGSGNDTLNGSTGDDLLTGGSGNDVFVYGASSDTVTDYGTGDKLSLTAAVKSFGSVGNDFVFGFDNGSLTLTDAASKKISVVGNSNLFAADGLYNSAGTAVTVNSSTNEFTANSKLVTINAASTSNATITGNSKANKVSLGNDNVFIWTGGNDTLSNFDDGDLISITGAVTDGSIAGDNSVIKVGSNRITVKDSSQVTFADTNGTRIFDGGIFFDEDETSATLATSTKDFDASDTDVISITGNAKANKLHASDSSTTLTGGKGNDSLWGSTGSDTFIYSKGDGTDKIFGFGEDDVLQILNADGSAGSFTKSTFANNGLTLNVAGGGKIIFDGVTSTSTFNINGDTYRVDGKSIVK